MSELINILKANSKEGIEYLENLKKRAEGIENDVNIKVAEMLSEIREKGDSAVINFTRKFDCESLESLTVKREEIDKAYEEVDEEFIEALKTAKSNITEFHEKQKDKSWIMTKENGIVMGQTVRGLSRVGIYVPGGTAAYPSSVMMNALPAKVAGVEKIVMVTPPKKDGTISASILVAADIAGVDEIYKVGGAQAIGALAYGTETIEKVDKIVGPGNIFVALAKRSVFGLVDIDMIAGPSEILIVSDENGNEKFIAADLMSQAEHDKLASAILVTTSQELAVKVQKEIKRQVESLSRKEIIETSLKDFGVILVVDNMDEAIDLGNKIAPEHFELMVKDPFLYLGRIKNAGSIFLGSYSPEPLGDYMAGPNHVLPTSGSARFFSPLSVDDFIKKSSYIYYSEEGLYGVKDKIVKLADTEGLTAHANSIKVRYED
ncbi:histidinol dehydrogenase [Clostridium pasteurianum DSM 525 = ATCC 6013]|uniref:Histidinol dehydrogenase n=1 Tax=Clostridium pasteurianum DSM 525 = ATCC 6013 TaxID=1262449 RepID=A0A0H3J783_CLOPA|nr:histidinol dehydrogenase [Clostridium pasteurianum]AJA49334.1 histidinol dehydrogenase [Clostridium pasteurianum DSM 525 = ATCC 6013]AJA53322.1 histidinol dehydrogenase [Clostridium pasteurianum DSM 525 = ATCC 6013]AOZ76509.1 histidinol dehydrogenase [Clostridium pasteurianum DSM 525 = ATCC 6013]AOZ80306.1 histidinol dehydrogenase [Clostridium pasteurianum]ELP58354.1 bifunctional histidinal dehydrogenase/ histidinol dehydrogenase [Clostridium pasteurianum DSM 525 = ATCC 6013]